MLCYNLKKKRLSLPNRSVSSAGRQPTYLMQGYVFPKAIRAEIDNFIFFGFALIVHCWCDLFPGGFGMWCTALQWSRRNSC